MVRPALVACAALVAGSAVGDAAPRGGKVVRVERHTERIGTPRYCSFVQGDLSHGQCFGHKVDIGETVMLVTTQGVVGKVVVTSATPDVGCSIADPTWQIEGELEKATAGSLRNVAIEGVIDGGLDVRRARLALLSASPSGRADDNDYKGFDTDGDGIADLQFDQFTCDAQGLPQQTASGQCFETWSTQGRGHELQRVRIDIVPPC